MPRKLIFSLLLALSFLFQAFCSVQQEDVPADAKVFRVRGIYLGPRLEGIAMRVEHEAIPGYMEAMTMDFKLEDPGEILVLKPGDQIEFDYLVLVDDTIARNVRRLNREKNEEGILFDFSQVNSEGLRGPPGGQVAVSYEFCIPDADSVLAEVKGIDATLSCSKSPGRVGCQQGESLCIGNTNQPGFREVLDQLAALPYIRRIREAHFE